MSIWSLYKIIYPKCLNEGPFIRRLLTEEQAVWRKQWMVRYPETCSGGNLLLCLGLTGPGENTEVWEPRHSWNRGGEGAQMEARNYCQAGSTETKKEVMKKYPDPSFLPSNLLPGLPLAKPNGKAVDGAVSSEQHPWALRSSKDGEWMREAKWRRASKTGNSTFLIPPWETLAHLGWDVHKQTNKNDVPFSTVYIGEKWSSLGRKLHSH